MGEPVKPLPRARQAGTILRVTRKDGAQRMRTRGRYWTEAAEAIFIDQLAASCNVRLSAAAAGFSYEAIYRRRRTDPGFAQRWQAALEQGYARIEIMLVEAATNALEGFEPKPDLPIPKMTVREALAVLQFHRGSVVGGDAGRRGWRARPPSLDEMKESILAKLSAIDAARSEG